MYNKLLRLNHRNMSCELAPLVNSLELSLSSFALTELFSSNDNHMKRCLSSMYCGLIIADQRAAGQEYKQWAWTGKLPVLLCPSFLGLLPVVSL
jgi:hypothetical protein